jgi:N-acetyl-gamma-glutamyl-phosphate reductase
MFPQLIAAPRSCFSRVRAVRIRVTPATRHVRGSNHSLIGVFADRIPGRAILVSVQDNLVKGASGHAIQNMNATALEQQPLFSMSLVGVLISL